MRSKWIVVGALVLTALLGTLIARSLQSPAIHTVAEANQLVAFDESGELRTLYPTEPDRFFAGPPGRRAGLTSNAVKMCASRTATFGSRAL